ncbi:hypothetical protein IWW36_001462 [Coemansia brasiliensis]|uniref:AMP-activated protein kinase glycogen-binding domain-containing protein n=1 Tax=Coemansia brasiliensis TaxID=2650707 RepID=A0A9W8M0D6_9FUNG|nr:hypothetical protein IWW36_001462 [Coemansia brasiliensis]
MASNYERVEANIVWTDGPADSVAIRGTFSDNSKQWWQETIVLHPYDQDIYSATLWLKPGQYAFKFIINKSEWKTSSKYATADDGNGNTNNVIDVLTPSKAYLDMVLVNSKAKQTSETTLSSNNGANNQEYAPSESSKLLNKKPGGRISGSAAESQLQPNARPRRDEEAGNAQLPRSQLRKYLIWAMVVLLFVLLGIASALMDSV